MKLNKLPPLYKKEKRLKDQYIQFLTSDVSMQAIGKLNERLQLALSKRELDCIDSTVERITRIFLDVADKCFTKIKNRTKRRRRQSNQKKWCDYECYQLKSELQNLAYLVKKFPRDPFLRGKLITTRKNYRRLVKMKYNQWQRSIIQSLLDLESNNPKEY